ncbi:MAG TPA: hypothetical protein DEQ80_00320 [Anaerolinea thermolimosa]|uniref:Uncharacterized protein n=1 Tax=Anaerolinea thermolimosa TaxID=229919 RepID=A0A3D1JDE9_9CHLR|nr:hypothetical protein [Anaerolinea thermolimosa]GAP07906.1 hypothetical protein ATHL_02802 [Anaerolinea thermolimosa]HCE16277.1 hypothetical protein [Anaerolinea thermolimosa]
MKKNKDEQPVETIQEERKAPSKAVRSQKKDDEAGSLPFLLELVFSFSFLILLGVDAAVAFFSFRGGATLLDIFLRVAISTVVMGAVLWLLAWQMSNGMLQAAYAEQNEKQDSPSKSGEDNSVGVNAGA